MKKLLLVILLSTFSFGSAGQSDHSLFECGSQYKTSDDAAQTAKLRAQGCRQITGLPSDKTPVTPTVTYEIKAPDGYTYTVEGPPDASKADVARAVLAQHPEAAIPKKSGTGATQKVPENEGTYSVELPDGNLARFPNTVSHDEAAAIIQKQFPAVETPLKNTASNSEPVAQVQVPEKTRNLFQDYYPEILWVLLFVLGVLIFAGPILGAFALGRRHHRLRPECRPFAWGYYNALGSLNVPIFIIAEVDKFGVDVSTSRIIFLIIILIYFPLAILTLRRNRWGFLLLTILSFNPVFWVINGIYLRNRWDELSPNTDRRVDERNVGLPPSSNTSSAKVLSSEQEARITSTEILPNPPTTEEAYARVSAPEAKVTGTAQPPVVATQQVTASKRSGSQNDEALYEQALTELSTNKKPGLWAMALAQTANGGNPDGAYIALRVEQLRQLEATQKQKQSAIDAEARNAASEEQKSAIRTAEALASIGELKRRVRDHGDGIDARERHDALKLAKLCGYDVRVIGGSFLNSEVYEIWSLKTNEKINTLSSVAEFVEWAVTTLCKE